MSRTVSSARRLAAVFRYDKPAPHHSLFYRTPRPSSTTTRVPYLAAETAAMSTSTTPTQKEKKTYHKKATGLALKTAEAHAAEHELKLFGGCFWYARHRHAITCTSSPTHANPPLPTKQPLCPTRLDRPRSQENVLPVHRGRPVRQTKGAPRRQPARPSPRSQARRLGRARVDRHHGIRKPPLFPSPSPRPNTKPSSKTSTRPRPSSPPRPNPAPTRASGQTTSTATSSPPSTTTSKPSHPTSKPQTRSCSQSTLPRSSTPRTPTAPSSSARRCRL